MSNQAEWARKELERAGLFDKDSDYAGALGTAAMELIQKFSDQGHSGGSASIVIELFNSLARWKPLSELTDDPEEWMEVAGNMWQSRRCPSAFSQDGGKTYYDLDDPRTNRDHTRNSAPRRYKL